jgi:hypothetical protein
MQSSFDLIVNFAIVNFAMVHGSQKSASRNLICNC